MTNNEGGDYLMIKRALFRVQPIEQLRKRKRRRKEMQEREEAFKRFVEQVKERKRDR